MITSARIGSRVPRWSPWAFTTLPFSVELERPPDYVKLPQAKATSGREAKSSGVQGGDVLRLVVAIYHTQPEVSGREHSLPPSKELQARGLRGGF